MDRWAVPEMWKGGTCFLIGGGPSMPREFGVPTKIINEVFAGKRGIDSYGPYLHPIHNQHVIGVNAAYLLGNWVSVCYFGDRSFFAENMKPLAAWPNLIVTNAALSPSRGLHYQTGIKKLKTGSAEGLSLDPKEIYWGRSSGAAAINFATLAGAIRIVLLGYDMNAVDVNGSRYTHWHKHYGKYRVSKVAFAKFLKHFPAIARDAEKRGIEILNASPDSAIDCFKKVKLKDVL